MTVDRARLTKIIRPIRWLIPLGEFAIWSKIQAPGAALGSAPSDIRRFRPNIHYTAFSPPIF